MSEERNSSQASDDSLSGSDDELEVYDVEVICAWRYNRQAKRREFLIKWRDWPDESNTWEPEENLSCPEPMEAFLKTLTKKQLKYFKAKDPDYLTGLQRNAEIKSIACDTSPNSQGARASTSRVSDHKPSDDCNFVLMIVFEDGEKQAEEVTMDEFFRHRPDEAFHWIEQRLIMDGALLDRSDVL